MPSLFVRFRFFIGTKVSATDSKDKMFISAEKHEISLEEAKLHIQRHKTNPIHPNHHDGSFDRAAIDKILAQPGCEKIKMYWAQENGRFTVVLVGVDAAGKDMITGTILERQALVRHIVI